MKAKMTKRLALACMWFLVASPAAQGATGFIEEFKIEASDGDALDSFGALIATSANRMVISAHLDEELGLNAGSVYVFEWNGSQWVQTAKLLASDGAEGDVFGISVAISGDRVAVGARAADGAQTDDIGAAYVFDWDGVEWKETKLLPSDGAEDDFFGISVAVSGDRAVVGAARNDESAFDAGAAYVFEWDGVKWAETAKLLASDGDGGDWFGNSVAMSGDRLVVGAPKASDLVGAAYVFDWDGARWVETAKLLASDGEFNDNFGSVAVSGDRVLVGASLGDNAEGKGTGAAYIFEWDGTKWVETAKLLASDGQEFDQFGVPVALSGDRAAVGAGLHAEKGNESGAAYVYDWDGTKWVETKLVASDGDTADNFGSVALSADAVLVGAPGDEGKGALSGSVYVFEVVVLGGTTSGMAPKAASCVNQDTGEVVAGVLVGEGWDCLEAGLEVFRGDRVFQKVDGRALGSSVGGTAFGVVPRAARCLNRTTGQSVDIELNGQTSWDCTAAGLLVIRGDRISQAVRGEAG